MEAKKKQKRAQLAAAVNGAHAMRTALMGGCLPTSIHGEGLDSILAQVPETCDMATQLIGLSKELQANVERLCMEREELEAKWNSDLHVLRHDWEAETSGLRQENLKQDLAAQTKAQTLALRTFPCSTPDLVDFIVHRLYSALAA